MANNIDERLLAGQLREEKRGSSADSTPLSAGDSPGSEQASSEEGKQEQTLRQRVQAARQALNLKEAAKKKLKEKVMAPAKQGLNNLLKQAWINLLDSFGLTLIWINIHVFLKWTLGEDLFCKLGEEWLPKQVTQAAGPGGDAAKTASKGFGLLEVVVLLILDLIVLIVILGVLALIAMIVNFMGKSWWGQLGDLWDAFWGIGWGGISALVDLFSSIKY